MKKVKERYNRVRVNPLYKSALLIFIMCFGIKPLLAGVKNHHAISPVDSATEVQAILSQGYAIENSLPAGYTKNGSIDYTTYLQGALDKYKSIIFPAFPMMINNKGLTIHTGQKIFFKNGSVLILAPTDQSTYQILRIHDVSDVSLYNPVIKGDKYNHLGTTGEWGMGISIRGASNINIFSAKIEQCWGDGIYIGPTPSRPFSDNLNLRYINCNDNRRNGISVISAKKLTLQSPSLTNTSGTAPMCGLDLEPNGKDDFLEDINVLNAITKNNQCGISFYLTPLSGQTTKTVNINIIDHYDKSSKCALQFGSRGSNISGKVTIENAIWDNNTNDAIKIINYEPTNGAQVILKNLKIIKPLNGSQQRVEGKELSKLKKSVRSEDTGVLIK